MKYFTLSLKAAAASAVLIASAASAHDLSMWPNKFSLHSERPTVVTVDLSFSELAYRFDHAANPGGFSVLDPKGKPLRELGNIYQSAHRSTVDLPIDQQGTYTLRYQSTPRYFTSYHDKDSGKTKFLRLGKAAAKAKLPKSATKVSTQKSITSGIAYITNTLPSKHHHTMTGKGLEITPVTDPSDYVTNEAIAMNVTYDGKPLTGVAVSLKRDGAQYTANSTPTEKVSDDNGQLTFEFEQGGRYLLSINHRVEQSNADYDAIGYRLYYAFEVVYE